MRSGRGWTGGWRGSRGCVSASIGRDGSSAPGGEAQLLDAATRLYGGLLDRERPLWELWLMTGLADGRVGALLKLHHAVADGMGAVAVMASLFDLLPLAADPPQESWKPRRLPTRMQLFRDNASGIVRKARRLVAATLHPSAMREAGRTFVKVLGRSLGQQGAPRTSLNGPVRAGRRVSVLRLERAAAKEVARALGGTINDLVLTLWTGGLRQLLASRGEAVDGLELAAGQAVSLRREASAQNVHNEVGTIVLPLPAGEPDPVRRFKLIGETTRTRRARRQAPAAIAGIMAALARTPLGAWLNYHQRAANVIVTNVPGPPSPVYLLGAPIHEIVPIIQLVGNIGLTLCAFSYAGTISLVVTADGRGFPDLDALMAGMADEWHILQPTAPADSTAVLIGRNELATIQTGA
jgi:WS/DGAT/MGAT family acyltransferase